MPDERTHWHDRWDEGRLGFHVGQPNAVLLKFQDRLAKGRILLPLCGKSLDLWYLAEQGFAPVGVELVPKAVDALFAERGVEPVREGAARRGGGVEVHVANVFDYAPGEGEPPFDAIWDRAALIALEPGERAAYAEHLLGMLRPGGTYLLDTIAYDQSLIDGPPWSVPDDEVRALFGGAGALEVLGSSVAAEIPPAMTEAGVVAIDTNWLLTRS